MADQQLQENISKKTQPQKGFFDWIQKHEKALNWSAAGLAVLIIGLFVVFYYSGAQTPQPESLKLANTVIRGKIELPANFEKTTPLVAATLSSEKQNSGSAALEKQTDHEPKIMAPVEKKIEMAAAPQEAIAPNTPVTLEAMSEPKEASEKDF